MPPKPSKSLTVDTLAHEAARRRNIPTAELEPVLEDDVRAPVRVAYARRNRDLDPQLVWRGKDEQDWSDLVVQAPPLFIQEKVHPKVLVDDLLRRTAERRAEPAVAAPDLFAFYDGLPDREARAEAYQHEGNWQNRMILGDSLQVMASLAEREGLRGKVQAIYFDPPYGIRFNSNFQWSTTSRDVKDGDRSHLTREPEQVKAFRDTWRDGIHSYLTYLRDRLTVARDLLTDSGSIFVQIGDENVHRVRALMDEVFGEECFVAQISTKTSGGSTGEYIPRVNDYILWHAKRIDRLKYRPISLKKGIGEEGADKYSRVRMPDLSTRALLPEEREQRMVRDEGARIYRQDNMTSQSVGRDKGEGAASWFPVLIEGESILPNNRVRWKTNEIGMERLIKASRLEKTANSISYVRYIDDYAAMPVNNFWDDIGGVQSRLDPKVYVVQTPTTAIQRCLLMATDPGDLVLDPTCGSGTTAYVAEQWGRRWITMDTSRVALALARTRIMAARFPWYILADSPEGQRKEAEETRTAPKTTPTKGDIRQGFVYERIPRITLKSIANNTEIDVIWERFQAELEPLRARLNGTLGTGWEEWEIPHAADPAWAPEARAAHAAWWERRIARQREIDASIAAKAEVEYLFDKPYPDPSRVRVAGPFTVESLSPHRTLAVGADDELVDLLDAAEGRRAAPGRTGGQRDAADFPAMVIEHLKAAGVQQAHKADRITFTSLVSWPGAFVAAEGRYVEGGQDAGTGEGAAGSEAKERRAGILIGPEFGTVSRPDLVAAAREAADAGFDVLIACAFNFDAHASEFEKLGRIKVLKARMNADLHMGGELKATGSGNLFVVFGEPDIVVEDAGKDAAGAPLIRVRIRGVDIFKPSTGEVESGGPETIAVWFLDTDYDRESFFVRHAYFPGASSDPYKALKTTLKAEIDAEAWATLNSDVSRPFPKPRSGRIAVKVINHLGDEVMKVFQVG